MGPKTPLRLLNLRRNRGSRRETAPSDFFVKMSYPIAE